MLVKLYEIEDDWGQPILNLDYKQCGLGGASCGPGTLPQYLIQSDTFAFSIRLRPFAANEDTPAQLCRQKLEKVVDY